VPRNGWNETDLRTRDADGDGVPAAGDCDNGDPTVWSIPGEAGPLVVAGDKQTFSWDPPSSPGGVPGSLVYDLLRAPRPDDFITLTSCVATNTAATSAVDGTTPVPGKPRWYLVRAENACGAGSLGRGINLMGRVGRNCP
jgi:hypothetical protein